MEDYIQWLSAFNGTLTILHTASLYINVLLYIYFLTLAAGRGVLPYGLPATDPRQQQLRAGRADPASASFHAASVPRRHRW